RLDRRPHARAGPRGLAAELRPLVPVLDLDVRPREPRADRERGGRPPGPPGRHDRNGDGEPHPRSEGSPLSNARLGMLMLLGGETMFFGGLVIAFLQLRLGAPVW